MTNYHKLGTLKGFQIYIVSSNPSGQPYRVAMTIHAHKDKENGPYPASAWWSQVHSLIQSIAIYLEAWLWARHCSRPWIPWDLFAKGAKTCQQLYTTCITSNDKRKENSDRSKQKEMFWLWHRVGSNACFFYYRIYFSLTFFMLFLYTML